MLETKSALSRPLVIGHRCDGWCRYDPVAKQELVQSCLQPGVSITRQALDHGINANLLRKWINHYQAAKRDNPTDQSVSALPAFVSVLPPVILSQANATISWVNIVQMTLQAVVLSEWSPLLNTLVTQTIWYHWINSNQARGLKRAYPKIEIFDQRSSDCWAIWQFFRDSLMSLQ